MFKILTILLFISISLNANLLHDKIENLIGEESYEKHLSLINFIFKDNDKFYYEEKFEFDLIIKELKKNGLLTLSLDTPKDILVEFRANSNPLKSLKILKDTLLSLGYYYYFTKTISYDGSSNLIWTIKLKTESAIDPLVLSKELKNSSCSINNISRDEDKWIYELDTQNAILSDAIYITNNEKVSLKKPLKPYFIKVEKASKLVIMSKVLNTWFPSVVFYDKDLKILKVTNKKKSHRNLTISIPESTKYIKISDLYTLINIKRGLSVFIKE